jgi:hypothetical protein
MSSEAEMLKEALARMKSGADDVATLMRRAPLTPFAEIVAELNPRTLAAVLPKIRAAHDAVALVCAMQRKVPKLNALGRGALRIGDGDSDDPDRDARVAAGRQEGLPLMLPDGSDLSPEAPGKRIGDTRRRRPNRVGTRPERSADRVSREDEPC